MTQIRSVSTLNRLRTISKYSVIRALICASAQTLPSLRSAVRLTEVDTAGKSWLVSYGLLNLTHRDGHEDPDPLSPGHFYDVKVKLNFAAHRFAKGNRIRVAISESLWPLVWPSPEPVTADHRDWAINAYAPAPNNSACRTLDADSR